ncbi:uncharacterized protein LOC132255459 [Phlebotomus argentipes]|uniref:uncharacterized protein LOC132255459 n=1 Tax=Phlebotomus argentipes TaxID=94469 RepID=UPI0028937A6E|nr:uncharacterized protein LOC132255459 [Phlebotomus argentipes]
MDHFRQPMECRSSPGKVLEKSIADSGYTSELSATSESQISHQYRSGTIEEDAEIDENQEPPTPTTRNLQRFSALQLTTPKSSPLKRRLDTDESATPKRVRVSDENLDFETPKKSNFLRKKSSIPLSPISNISKSASKILGENQFDNLSSTPIKHGFRPDFYVETVENVCWNPLLPKSRSPKMKRKLLKKIQSFSPRKWQVSRNSAKLFGQCSSPIHIEEDVASDGNPAQALIAFNTNQFENLLGLPKHSSSAEVRRKSGRDVAPAAGLESFSSSGRGLETVHEEADGLKLIPLEEISSHSIKEYFHEMRSMTEDAATGVSMPRSTIKSTVFRHKNSLDFLDIPRREEVKNDGEEEVMDISITSQQMSLDDSVVEVLPTKGVKRAVVNGDYSPSVLQTPKKTKRPMSFQYSSDEEKNRILYPHLPCTPPKKRARKALEYSSRASPSPAKKALDYREGTPRRCRPPKRSCYDGAVTLNILSRLAGTVPALDRIFSYLRPEDLHAVYNVCREWRFLVDGHRRARKRLSVYEQEQIPIKENTFMVKKVCEKPSVRRIHLRDWNFNDDTQAKRQNAIRSPPASPSTRKHRDHQKFLDRLDAHAKVINCPKCSKSSLIMSPRRRRRCSMAMAKKSPAKRNLFRPNSTISAFPVAQPDDKILGKVGKSHSLPSNLTVFEQELCLKDRSLIADGMNYDTYAICSRESCRFTFCTTCFMERHEVGKCVQLEPESPGRADEEYRRSVVPGSKRSKRNLKRL